MTVLALLGYLADVAILGTYAFLARSSKPVPFHLANAIGCIPLIAIEVRQAAWPVVPLTATFGVIGAAGYIKEQRCR